MHGFIPRGPWRSIGRALQVIIDACNSRRTKGSQNGGLQQVEQHRGKIFMFYRNSWQIFLSFYFQGVDLEVVASMSCLVGRWRLENVKNKAGTTTQKGQYSVDTALVYSTVLLHYRYVVAICERGIF